VTGAAGFIASHLCRRLLKEGFKVVGIDSFTDFYPKRIKEKNIKPLRKDENFEFITGDLNDLDLATQKLLEVAKNLNLKKFIYASSSSVYGNCPDLPMSETSPLHPFSPYGVTKLAAENLCLLYCKNYGVPSISLRFFTVYGPGQRPDMSFHKFFKAMTKDKQIPVYGDGNQTRDFTYIDDVIDANFASLKKGKVGEIYNIGGGTRKKLKDIFPLLENICQKQVRLVRKEKQKGDVSHTFANIEKARKDLNYSPQIKLRDGLKEEWLWTKKLYSS
jgi:UDP-glucose 4-epimerase